MADKNMEAQISVEFEEATSRQSLNSGETINTLWSKVKRWLSDLKTVCFSGSYNDLSDTPTTATKDTDGLMSAEDKSKLDGVATGANKTIVDTILSNTSTNPVQNKVVKQAIDNKADKTVATTSANGLMSAEDKVKLDNADDTYALKSKYGDTTINVGRKAETKVGAYSTAEGNNTTASSWASHAEGDGTTASSDYSHAEGKSTAASGLYSHAEGGSTTASGNNSHAEGRSTIASNYTSHAEGNATTASGNSSHAEGQLTTASGFYSHAEGNNTTASGDYSHAEGNNTTASGGSSHAEGYSSYKVTQLITDFLNGNITKDDIINTWNTKKFSVAHGNESHVEGQDNLSLGHYSHTEGLYTVAIGNQSHTSGYYTKALHDNEAAYGKYNESNDNTLFSIGDGTADDARHNAFEITTTGGKLHNKDIATTDLIPTSLPANGGNADTLDGMHANDFPLKGNQVQFVPYNMLYYALNNKICLFANDDSEARGIYFINNSSSSITVCVLVSATAEGPVCQYGYGTNTYPEIQNTGENREWYTTESIPTSPVIFAMEVPPGKLGYYGFYFNSASAYTTVHDIRCPYFNFF